MLPERTHMIRRLTRHYSNVTPECCRRLIEAGISRDDALALRRIAMTLHRWHELECGDGNDHASWTIARGKKDKGGAFEYSDNGAPYLEKHYHDRNGAVYSRIPDREKGAQKRLAKIMAKYPNLSAYVQGDPRGCSLFILRPGDIPQGKEADAYYSRGIAVFK